MNMKKNISKLIHWIVDDFSFTWEHQFPELVAILSLIGFILFGVFTELYLK